MPTDLWVRPQWWKSSTLRGFLRKIKLLCWNLQKKKASLIKWRYRLLNHNWDPSTQDRTSPIKITLITLGCGLVTQRLFSSWVTEDFNGGQSSRRRAGDGRVEIWARYCAGREKKCQFEYIMDKGNKSFQGPPSGLLAGIRLFRATEGLTGQSSLA